MANASADLEGFWVDFIGTASYVSMSTLAVYDYFITFDQEVRHIWKQKFNVSSVIYIVIRYANLYGILGSTAFELFARTRLVIVSVYGFRHQFQSR
ncbi:hypothetical protein C8Q75DRAFT_288012 [Abortiporus biennis]|nr:hypothetical protein C8Q75DRAFT_288012 [Abortiporus biennis]